MPMNKTIANLKLVKDKVSDFKLELGRIKDEFTRAISALQTEHLQQATESNDRYSIGLFSDVDKTVKYFTKTDDFSFAVDKINQLITTFSLDVNLKIVLSNNLDIANFLNIFASEYGLIKFYKNTKDQVLLDFDSVFNSDEARAVLESGTAPTAPISAPVEPPSRRSRGISIFDKEEEEEEAEEVAAEEAETPVAQGDEASALNKEDKLQLEHEVDNICFIPQTELIVPPEPAYDGEYYIRSFVYKVEFKNKTYRKDLFAGVTPDGKWLATKSGRFIFATTELKAENNIVNFAAKAIEGRPSNFVSWNQTGGMPKRGFYDKLPQIGRAGSSKDGDDSTLNEAVIAHNLNYSSHFFTREETPLLRKFDIAEGKLKRELKEDLNLFAVLASVYPDLARLQNQDMILYVDETTTPHKLVVDEAVARDFNNFVLQKISEIKRSLESSYTSAATSRSKEVAENSRYENSKKIDDLIGACKVRDRIIYSKFLSLKGDPAIRSIASFDPNSIDRVNVENILVCNLLKNPNTNLGSELMSLTQLICFASSNYINSFAANMVRGYAGGSDSKILLDEEMITKAFDQFSGSLRTQISSKITSFFSSSRVDTSGYLYCRYMASSIKLNGLYLNAYNFAAKPIRLGWNYISCPTCKKDIYYSKYKESSSDVKSELVPLLSSRMGIPEEKAKVFLDPKEMSDYEEERYSFFRQNGTIITTQELRAASQQSGKNWDEILRMISSNNQAEHNAGVKERQMLLQSMGAKLIKRKRGISVFTYKTKCPFSGGQLPESIRFVEELNKKGISLTDFSCGLSLNVDDLLETDRKLEPYELHSAPYDPTVDAEDKLNEAINTSIQKGIFSEEDRERFVAELRKRRSGGWKFSNTMFRCPCKPSANSDKTQDNLKGGKYKYVASPISGFFMKELEKSGVIHPPTTEYGDLHDMADYTASYFVCGDLTSISSFCRDTSDPNSLYGILKSKIRSAMENSSEEARGYLSNFIDTLLQLGVDFNDILPFIDKLYSEEFKTAISSSHKSILNSIIKVAVDATEMDALSHDRVSNLSRSGILGDLKLVCSNGHRFKIIDSIKFGQTHTGHSVSAKSLKGSAYYSLKDLLEKNGVENLIASLQAQIPGNKSGQTILSRVAKNSISSNMKNFAEWDGIWDSRKGLSDYYYIDRDGNYYVFNSRSTSVVWGDYNKEYSVMPFVERDDRTKLLISANPLKVSDDASGEGTEGEGGPTLSDRIQAENFVSTINDITDSSQDISLIDTSAHERAKLDIYYSPLAVILQSALASIKDFCDRSTSTALNFPMHGKPVSFKNENKVTPVIKEIIGKFYLRQAQESEEDEENVRESYEEVVESAFAYFDKNYLEQLRVQDLRFLNMLEPSISPIEKATISRMILMSVNAAIGERAYELRDISSRIFDPSLKEKIQSELFSSDLGTKIDEVVSLIKSNIEPPKATAVKGLLQGAEQAMISKLQGNEYIGRVLMMSSALYLSETVSRLYRKYLDENSPKYIGVDIGIDLSSPDKIIKMNPNLNDGSIFALSEAQINGISTSFPFRQLLENQEYSELDLDEEDLEAYQDIDNYQAYLIDEVIRIQKVIERLEAENKEIRTKDPAKFAENSKKIRKQIQRKDELREVRSGITQAVNEFLDSYGSFFLQFFDEIKDEMGRVQTACTNYKYTERAVHLMRESLLKKIEVDKGMDDTARKITATIVNRCITNSPITTISLSGGDKYHAYYAGETASTGGGPFRVLPLFNADQVIIPGLPPYAPPVYALSGSNNSFSNLGVQLSQAPPIKKHVILYKDITGDFIEPFPTSLPDDVVLSGWKTGVVDGKKFAIKSVKEISLYYHPFTLAVLADGTKVKPSLADNVVGFVNSHVNYNSVAGFNFGPLSTRSGTASLYPTPYSHGDRIDSGGSHIGLFLPLKYSKSQEKLKQGSSKAAPFFDAKIPIEIPTDSPGKTIKINISDFLVRDPPELAQQILTQISNRYVEYKEAAARAGTTSEKKRLREECKRDVAELFDRYRHLPYSVTNTSSSSRVNYEGKMGGEDPTMNSSVLSSVTPYIPMADFVTCNRILNLEEFSPEFGGHNFWSEGDADLAPTIKGAIEQMIIESNSLDDLADIMNQQLNDSEIKITARDLMDPHHGVFDKIYLKVKKDKTSRVGSRTDVTEEDIRLEAIKLIRSITTYNVGDDYVPLSSSDNNEVRRKLSYSYRTDRFWGGQPENKPLTETARKFGRWIASIGKFYPIREGLSTDDDQPGARIKVMSELFPFNKEDGTGRTEALRMVQDPNSGQIISLDDFNYASFLYGSLYSMSGPYYSGKTPEESAKFFQELKKAEGSDSMIISAVKYASGISDFFSNNIVMGLRQRIQLEKERRDLEYDKRRMQEIRPISKKASVMKSGVVKIRVAPMDAVDNIRMAGMISLLSMFTK